MNKLEQTIKQIERPNLVIELAASDYLDTLTKPPGSLGKLEELAI